LNSKLKDLRFKYDSPINYSSNSEVLFKPHGLSSAPANILKSIDQVKKKLNLDINIRSYICPANKDLGIFNAFASRNNNIYFIVFTKQLTRLLNKDELRFIIGHEIGHIIFGHTNESRNLVNAGSLNLQSQCAEVSADRIGYVSVDSISVAASATHKLQYGMRYKENKINIKKLTDYINDPNSGHSTSHPTNSLRLESIIRFSMSEKYRDYIKDSHHIFKNDKLDESIYKKIKKQIS
jgi:Zn-dependent protease with chaperone function